MFLFIDGPALVCRWVNFAILWPHTPVLTKLKCPPVSHTFPSRTQIGARNNHWTSAGGESVIAEYFWISPESDFTEFQYRNLKSMLSGCLISWVESTLLVKISGLILFVA